MSISIHCPTCDSTYEVEESDVGEQVQCQCGEVFVVESPDSATGSVTAAASDEQWFVQAADGTQSGPISKSNLDELVLRGQIDSETQLLKDGEPQWQWADTIYPELAPKSIKQQASQTAAPSAKSQRKKPSRPSSSHGAQPVFQLDGTIKASLIQLILNPIAVDEVAEELDHQSTLRVGLLLIGVWLVALIAVFMIVVGMPPGWFKIVSRSILVLSIGSATVFGCCFGVRSMFGERGGLHTDVAAIGTAMAHCGLVMLAATVFQQVLSDSLPKTTQWVCGGLLFSAFIVSAIALFCGMTRCAGVPDRPADFSLSVAFVLCGYVMYLTADALSSLPPFPRF